MENLYEAVRPGLPQVDEKKLKAVLEPIVAKKATSSGKLDGVAPDMQDRTIVLFSEPKTPPKALTFLLGKNSKVEEFDNLADAERVAFIKKEANAQNVIFFVWKRDWARRNSPSASILSSSAKSKYPILKLEYFFLNSSI